MTEPDFSAAAAVNPRVELSAGAMLRAAREKRGLHIAALAASIKVTPRKLEALEADRHGELPDMTFTRALTQTVCRALKIDAAPVLAKLPQAGDMPRLSQVGGGLNMPFRESSGKSTSSHLALLRKPMFWATATVLAAALVVGLLPSRWVPWQAAVEPAASAAAVVTAPVPASTALPGVAPAASVLAEAMHPAPVQDAAVIASAVLVVRTNSESWVEVLDARGQSLLSRAVQAGETVGLDGALPLRVTIGNAAATQLTFQGQSVDLSTSTKENVARLQLP